MKDSLHVGLEARATYTVTEDMSPGHLPMTVLSTPSMIMLIEGTCLGGVQEHLDETETTVGVHVCVSHDAAAVEGQEFEVAARLVIRDRRRLTFETRVTAGDTALSTGTHVRMVIDTSRFG
ncbi:MAG: thioesterase [Actinomycetota bacterium]